MINKSSTLLLSLSESVIDISQHDSVTYFILASLQFHISIIKLYDIYEYNRKSVIYSVPVNL